MRYLILSLLYFFNSYSASAQSDTTWFNKYWVKISTKDSAVFFRPPSIKLENGHYQAKDYYISTGKIQEDGVFSDENCEVKDGTIKRYYETGEICWLQNYKEGLYSGSVIGYYKNGKIAREEVWKRGKLKSGKCYTKTGADTAYYEPKCCPEFPGGLRKYAEYLALNTRYPEECRKLKIKGTIHAHVYFNEQGKVVYVELKDKLHPLIDEEAKRVLMGMPNWGPVLDFENNPTTFGQTLFVFFNWKY
ncbi:MAG: hypothetical protein JST82_14980 [Bacteroidetes bacterium]|nr:hypothetical protein [Bacteroidota bacterium]